MGFAPLTVRGDTFAVLLRMIAEAGLGALWMAVPLALLRLGLTVRPARAADHDAGVHALVFTQATLTVFALLALIALFLRADTSVALVAAHSHASKSWLDRLADVWTTGSAGVLSLAALAGFVGAAAAQAPRTRAAALLASGAIDCCCYAALLLGLQPFARTLSGPTDGHGLTLHHPVAAFLPLVIGFAIWLAVVLARALDERAAESEAAATIWPFAIASLGAAVMLGGVVVPTAFTTERSVAIAIGQPQQVGPFTVTLDGVRPVVGNGWSAPEGHVTVRRGDGTPYVLRPQARYYSNPPAEVGAPAIATHLDGEFHAEMGERQPGGRWRVRLSWRPLAHFVWVGALLMLIGGGLALIGWRRRVVCAREAAIWA